MSTLPLEADLGREIPGAFKGEIEPVKVPLIYRLGLFLIALAMILLPVIYISLIVGTGYGIFYHAVNNTEILSGSGLGIFSLIFYLAPIVAGAILVLSFSKLANEISIHPSSSKGGDIGRLKLEDLNEEFRAALKGIKEGCYTSIVQLNAQ